MAWIKFKDPMGKEFTVPESVFKNMFAGNSAFTLVQESKPAPEKKEEKKLEEKKEEEIVKDEQAQQSGSDETIANRKNPKKAVS